MKLKTLNAKLSQISSLAPLVNCVALESVDATETGLGDIEGFGNKPNLEVLELPSNNISEPDWFDLRRRPSLPS